MKPYMMTDRYLWYVIRATNLAILILLDNDEVCDDDELNVTKKITD